MVSAFIVKAKGKDALSSEQYIGSSNRTILSKGFRKRIGIRKIMGIR